MSCYRQINKLVEDSCDLVIKASMQATDQKNNPYLVDYALDLLIKHLSYNLMKATKYTTLKEKLKDFMRLYVVRNFDQDIDFSSDENEALLSEIERYWSIFIKSNDGTEQLIKCRASTRNDLTHGVQTLSKSDFEKNDNDMIITPITTV